MALSHEKKLDNNRIRLARWREANPDKVAEHIATQSERMKKMRKAYRQIEK